MTARSIGRGRGVVIECNRCGDTIQTANIIKSINRWHAKIAGWGRGACPAVRTLEERRDRQGKVTRAGRIGSLSTKTHDLCPKCLPLDRTRAAKMAAERKAKSAAKVNRMCAVDKAVAK